MVVPAVVLTGATRSYKKLLVTPDRVEVSRLPNAS
jgi:hypothetical protein